VNLILKQSNDENNFDQSLAYFKKPILCYLKLLTGTGTAFYVSYRNSKTMYVAPMKIT